MFADIAHHLWQKYLKHGRGTQNSAEIIVKYSNSEDFKDFEYTPQLFDIDLERPQHAFVVGDGD